MYQYGDHDGAPIGERVAQFRDQVGRRLGGEFTEEKSLPLRLQNGLYLQRHACMFRVAIQEISVLYTHPAIGPRPLYRRRDI